ncbi:uncharacterized protein A1O9_00399 [Exophiala aquamarina CBS 119918]|uniref:FHA domain-containing protein n=1 Tax=Exophiala aquamarina CBS 119918 TaxID=1182545 RepID=A0A072PRP9_9EURO|nr:uncharacterized protein A1O9_00399 [Exophiala aquamarina CBS 119918]KEF62427.1 hypothetical protein A1O9_00399 [Exophiala aquamarina CBS 119918]
MSRSRSRSSSRRRDRISDRPPPRYRDDYREQRRDRSRNGEQERERRRSTSPNRNDERYPRKDRGSDRRRDEDWTSTRTRDRDNTRQRPRSRSPRRHSPAPFQRSKRPLPSQNDAFKGGNDIGSPGPPAVEKQKPNYRPSGLLAAAANTVTTSRGGSVVLKYHEPAEARKPSASQTWRLYVFKGDEILDTLDLFSQSCWLFGREASVCDYLIEHPSCSKQHAVIQFRYMEKKNEFGDKVGRVRPYLIDLESGNGTKVNNEAAPAGRYFELRDKDVLKFGHSTREYVVQLPKP